MPTVGAVMLLREDARPVDFLPPDPVIVGERQGARLPIAFTTDDRRATDALLDELLRLPGVLDVQIAFVHDGRAEAAPEVSP